MNVSRPDDSPLLKLADMVREFVARTPVQNYFRQIGVTPPVIGTVGWKQRQQILTQGPGGANRVLFIPGSYPKGEDLGQLVPPRRRKGPTERVLATWERVITASIWAVDASSPDALRNEEKQIAVADQLHQFVVGCLRSVALGDFPGPGKMFRDPAQSENMGFGIEYLYQFVHYEEVLDLPVNLRLNVSPNLVRDPAS